MDKLHLLSEIEKYAKTSAVRLHMPGHKGRLTGVLSAISEIDVTELNETEVVEKVKKAEEDVAKIYGAKLCKILTNGATGGILSSVYAVKNLGDKMIINRTAHKSVYNALKLCGIEPIILDFNGEDIVKETELALENNPTTIGAFFTYPDYFGNVFNAKAVRLAIKKAGKLLLLDNAHGAHIRFTSPEIYAGEFADIWVDSAHKTLPALNQGAMLFCSNAKLFDSLLSAVNIFSTTSPSYPIMASVEYGVKYMDSEWKKLKHAFETNRNDLKVLVKDLGASVLESSDIFKLTIDFSPLKLDAFSVEKLLAKQGVFVELNDGDKILLMFSALNTREDFKKTYSAIKQAVSLASEKKETEKQSEVKVNRVMPYITATEKESEYIKLKSAIGRVCAENIGVFPPCYPLVTAGEEITDSAVFVLTNAEYTFGIKDGKVKVVKE